jgi:hypothetical protein
MKCSVFQTTSPDAIICASTPDWLETVPRKNSTHIPLPELIMHHSSCITSRPYHRAPKLQLPHHSYFDAPKAAMARQPMPKPSCTNTTPCHPHITPTALIIPKPHPPLPSNHRLNWNLFLFFFSFLSQNQRCPITNEGG